MASDDLERIIEPTQERYNEDYIKDIKSSTWHIGSTQQMVAIIIFI